MRQKKVCFTSRQGKAVGIRFLPDFAVSLSLTPVYLVPHSDICLHHVLACGSQAPAALPVIFPLPATSTAASLALSLHRSQDKWAHRSPRRRRQDHWARRRSQASSRCQATCPNARCISRGCRRRQLQARVDEASVRSHMEPRSNWIRPT